MKQTYNSLTLYELGRAIVMRVAQTLKQVKGMESRLVTVPRADVEIIIRIKGYNYPEQQVESLETFAEQAYGDDVEIIRQEPMIDETVTVRIDESKESVDSIRRSADLPVPKPQPLPNGQIVDYAEPNPLPAGESFDNIREFGKPGLPLPGTNQPGSGRGRIIELETVGLSGANPIREKLKGDPNASNFKIRQPGER